MRNYIRRWAKTRKAGFHLFPCHSLDVAAICHLWLERDAALTKEIGRACRISPSEVPRMVAAFGALHDLGKLSPAFQAKAPDVVRALTGTEPTGGSKCDHGPLGYYLVKRMKEDNILPSCFSSPVALSLMAAAAAHHGRAPLLEPPADVFTSTFNIRRRLTASEAFDPVSEWVSDIATMFKVPGLANADLKLMQTLEPVLYGFFSVCDWLGSNELFELFGDTNSFDLKRYWTEWALPTAEKVLDHFAVNGMLPVQPAPQTSLMTMMERAGKSGFTPTPLQSYCETLAHDLDGPFIAVLEDLTGGGKTEASYALVQGALARGISSGAYWALPTMATANGLYDRVQNIYRSFFAERASLVLAHGRAHMNNAFSETIAHTPDDWEDGEPACQAWLADSRKKALLAHAGVGTIDQASIGSLRRVKHGALRLFGLWRKVVVVDEVHAYDDYVLATLRSLLRFMGGVGASVILLSATLPSRTRKQLVGEYCAAAGWETTDDGMAGLLPQVTFASQSGLTRKAVTAPDWRKSTFVHFSAIHSEHEVICRLGKVVSTRDGCAAWFRNSVADAQWAYSELLKHLTENGMSDDEARSHVILFHSRFLISDRDVLEEKIKRQFGPDSTSNDRSGYVVVATQVIEQSLDIDFDHGFVDICPIDAIIQRIGRIRRHIRDANGNRIPGTTDGREETPTWLLCPQFCDGREGESWLMRQPHNRSAKVYQDHGRLWLTAHAVLYPERYLENIRNRKIGLEAHSKPLVELVYSDHDTILPLLPENLRKSTLEAKGGSLAKSGIGNAVTLTFQSSYQKDSLATDSQWTEDGEDRPLTRLGDSHRVCLLVCDGETVQFVDSAKVGGFEHSLCGSNRPVEVTPLAEAARTKLAKRLRQNGHKILAKRLEFTATCLVKKGAEGIMRQVDGNLTYNSVLGLQFEN